MHMTALSAPLRTAALGTRISSGPLAPFAYSTSSFQQSCRSISTKQRRQPAGTVSKCQNNPLFQSPIQGNVLKSSRSQSVQSIAKIAVQRSCIRSNSTTSAASATTSSSTQDAPLDWNTFFKLRTSRRRYSLGSSIVASIASTAIGVQILSSQDLENLGAQVMGLDPFVVLGLATAACGAVGWLAGPFLGNAVWGLVHRRYKSGVAVKEKEFYNRIKRHRVDPSSNSLANPVPDYYGEKIGSVQGYRQWLKDQRAYNRKKNRFIL
ncbi:hypothetical protein DTO217A2_9204 [Paecilomyces variotii]|nr:hypothetical protein DTO217A2_9204 [Paecilomyces variotii]